MTFNLSSTINKIRKEEARLTGVRKDIEKKLKGYAKILRAFGGASAPKKRRKKMSAAGRRAIAAAQKARWAKIRAQKKD
jgi:DeoR/GlpR family transcriptional regulator of sugar metabolism